MRTFFVIFSVALQCCSQIQQQEIRAHSIDWSCGASAFNNLFENSRIVRESTFSVIKNEQSPTLYYHYYQDGFSGDRYVITDDPHIAQDGSRLMSLQRNDRVILHKVRWLTDNKTGVDYQIALIEFDNGKERVFGEYLYLNSSKEASEPLPENLKGFASTTPINKIFSFE